MISELPRWGILVFVFMWVLPASAADPWKVVYGEDGFFVWRDYAVDDGSLKRDGETVDFRMREIKKVSKNSMESLNTHEHRIRIHCRQRTSVVLESSSTRDSLQIDTPYRVDYFPGERIAGYVCEPHQ